MRVLLTGATGFIGTYVLDELVGNGHTVRCLVRRTGTLPASPAVEEAGGDLLDPASLEAAASGCDAVIHLVGIIEERPRDGITFDRIHADGTRNVVAAARAAGIARFVHMSANGARPDGVSAYQTSKWRAEETVRSAGFDRWTIFRPSLVFGRPGPGQPEFCSRLADTLVGPFPVLPVFGDGAYRMRPVAVEEVASAIVQALTQPDAANRAFCAGGDLELPYDDILDVIARGMGIGPKPKIHQPLWLVRPVIRAVGRFGLLPISPDQFEMLVEGNTCDPADFRATFALPGIPFEPERLGYLRGR